MKHEPQTPTGLTATPSRITRRQGEFLAFILRYTQKRGIAPSYEEMATHFGISSPSVNGMMKTLERNGFISRVPGAARSVRVEVRPEDLPASEFAPAARSGAAHRATRGETGNSACALAVAAATAVLDAVMPQLIEVGVTDSIAIGVVVEAAKGVRDVLLRSGVTDDDAEAAGRQVSSQAARWRSHDRGVSIPGRTWQRRP